MKKLFLLLILTISSSVFAQNAKDVVVITPDKDSQNFKSQDELKKLVPSLEIKNENAQIQTDESVIFGRENNIFPKSEIPKKINPTFDTKSFEVNEAKKRFSDLEFTPEAVQGKGTNDLFDTKSSREVKVPPELQEFFDGNKGKTGY